jgi:hypothetical protein
MTSRPAAGERSTVDLWLDPSCPLTRHTSRWLDSIAAEAHLVVRRRVMSLSVLNEHREDDPEGDPHGYLWIPARIAAAVQTEHGHGALAGFYDALWTEADGTEREWIGDFAEALHRSGLPADLAGVGETGDYDQALRASHREGVERIDAEVGTPVLTVTTPRGDRRSFFGPVLHAVPEREEGLRLWEALAHLVRVPHFHELKA